LNRGFGAGSEEFENRVPSFAAWLGVFGTLLRLAIPMAIVIGIIKLVRWMERRSKPQRIMKGENARS
jgi:hypothetical protein